MPKISIIIPTYNRPNYIKALLQNLLLQTFKDFEVIISDDGSSNSPYPVVKEFEKKLDIKYIWEKDIHWNQLIARNLGIKIADGEILFISDDDVFYLPDCLKHHYLIHKKQDKIMVYGEVLGHPKLTPENVNEYILQQKYPQGGEIRPFSQIPKNFSVKRKYVFQINGYDRRFAGRYGYEDIDFHKRLERLGLKVFLLKEAKAIAIYGRGIDLKKEKEINKKILEENDKQRIVRCKRGLYV